MAWAKNGTPDTLSSSGDTISISDLIAKTFNQIMWHALDTGGSIRSAIEFNNDTSSVYATRRSSNGAADVTGTSQANLIAAQDETSEHFGIAYIVSISGKEKLVISNSVQGSTAEATTAPLRQEQVGKYVPSPDADITRIDIENNQAGSYDTNSNLSALSGNVTKEVMLGNNVQSGSRFEATDTRKIYYSNGTSWTEEA